MSTLTELAEKALANAKLLDAYTASQGLPPVSLEKDSLTVANLPPRLHVIRNELADTSQLMKRLALGPVGNMVEILYTFTDILSLQAIVEYNLVAHVPLSGTTTYAEISKSSNLNESLCRRFLVHAMENGVFLEDAEGKVKHSALSCLLATDPEAFAAAGLIVFELAPASGRVLEALQKYPDSGEPNETAYNIQNNTDLSIYSFLGQNPSRMSRFGMGMQFFSRSGGFHLQQLIDAYPWSSLDKPGAVMVDVGGGLGTVSKTLANATKNLRFVVQDLAGPVGIGRETLPEELKGRVDYEAGDFFGEQKIVGADVYFFRWIFHNWSDEYCVKLLRSVASAMRKHSKLMLYEYVLAEGPELKVSQKFGRNLDMVMMACWNACERTESQWKKLFKSADERFSFVGTRKSEGSSMSIVE
ncbi:O-methyltransferase gsfB, partial [Lachnellula suecica]